VKKALWKVGLVALVVSGLITASIVEGLRPKGFHPRAIRSPLEFSAAWNTEVPSKATMAPILTQDYFYLGSGAQCYAFISADGKYVLKFFKMKHLLPKKWLRYFPFPGLGSYRFRKTERRVARQKSLFHSYTLAWEHLQKETGLVYVHLNKTDELKLSTLLFEKEGDSFSVDLDQYEFIVQRKSTLVREYISNCMKADKKEKAVEAIEALLGRVVALSKKGFVDQDSGVSHNYGFVGGDVIHFDVGQLIADPKADEPSHYQREVLRVAYKLEMWLKEDFPELLPHLEESIGELIDSDAT
jgi:hypothetical protein